jgi:hypothetical protein
MKYDSAHGEHLLLFFLYYIIERKERGNLKKLSLFYKALPFIIVV